MSSQAANPLPLPSSGGGSFDIGRAFSFVFEDPEWVRKVLIGGVIGIIPIVNFATTGYGLAELRQSYEGRELPLPEWNDFGGYFVKGLFTWVAGIIYSLPILLLYCCFLGIPAAILGNNQDQSGTSGGIISTLAICLACIAFLYALALAFVLPAVYTRFALTDQFAAFFQFREAWDLVQTNTSGYITAVLVSLLVLIVAGLLAGITCGIGAIVTHPWSMLVLGYIFGKFAQGIRGMPATAPITPPPTTPPPTAPFTPVQ